MLRTTVCVAVGLVANAQGNDSAWNFTADGKVLSSPSIGAGGRQFFGTERGTIYALSDAGALEWKLALPNCPSDPAVFLKISCAPAISTDGTLYFRGRLFKGSTYSYGECGNVNAVLYALSMDGTMKWNYTYQTIFGIAEQQDCAAISKEGTVYIDSDVPYSYDGMVRAINPDGSLKWNHTFAENWMRGTPVLEAVGALLAWGWRDIFSLDATGALMWSFKWGDTCCEPKPPAVASDGTVYVSPYQRTTYAISAEGVPKWNFTAESTAPYTPALGLDGTIYVADYQHLYALDSTGVLKWSYATGGMSGQITTGPDRSTSRLHVVDTDGKMIWNGNLGHGVSTRPTISTTSSIYMASEQVLAVPSFRRAKASYLTV